MEIYLHKSRRSKKAWLINRRNSGGRNKSYLSAKRLPRGLIKLSTRFTSK
jgi:hypothetical protein